MLFRSEKIFFKHIPRTAGISFIESLQEIYKDDFYHVNYESIIDIPLNKSCIAGRINNIDNRHNITIIRNPVDRVISQFFHEISVFKKYDKKYNIKNLITKKKSHIIVRLLKYFPFW